MANAEGIRPAKHEIKRQLERMLAHPLFKAREIQSNIFAYLVKSALDGNKKVDELALFQEFYSVEQYKTEGSHVRTTVNYIRGLLKQYYAQDDMDDPVIITLPTSERFPLPGGKYKVLKRPPGEAYTPEFRYNPRSAIAREFAIAHHLLRGSASQIGEALKRFGTLFHLDPNHPDVVLGMTEAFGSQLLLGVYDEDVREGFVAAGLGCIASLSPAANPDWRVHNVRGLLHTAAGKLEEASKEFDIALVLDRQGTVSRGWYAHFLFLTGQEEEAVRLMSLLAEENADDSQPQAAHGVFLFTAKRYDEAERALAQALMLDRNYALAHWGIALVYDATGRTEQAMEHAQRLEALVEPSEYEGMKRRLNPEPPARQR
jgi:tetratricopeptide (TPR) repeat protein